MDQLTIIINRNKTINVKMIKVRVKQDNHVQILKTLDFFENKICLWDNMKKHN